MFKAFRFQAIMRNVYVHVQESYTSSEVTVQVCQVLPSHVTLGVTLC